MALLQKKAFGTGVAQKASRRTSVRVCAVQGQSNVQKAQAVAAAFAAAALLHATPASAGVILEKPQLKKVLQSDETAAPAPKREIILPGMRSKAAPGAAAAPKAKAAPRVAETSGSDLDPRAIALPASLVVIAGGAVAISKLDEGFGEFMDEASCKNSGLIGAGYEPTIKGGALAVGGKSRAGSKPGTKKVKAATKSSGTSPLASFFDK